MDQEALKRKIIFKFIHNSAFDGWNDECLAKSCKELELEPDYHEILFPGGIKEITQLLSDTCNNMAFDSLDKKKLKDMRISEKVEEIIFQKIVTYHDFFENNEALKKFIAYGTQIDNIGNSAKNIFSFSNDVWRLIGDNSTDFSYYTKRLSLSQIYVNTLIYSLTDEKSANKEEPFEKTRNFLKRNIDGLMKFHKLKAKIKNYLPGRDFIFKKRA